MPILNVNAVEARCSMDEYFRHDGAVHDVSPDLKFLNFYGVLEWKINNDSTMLIA